MRAEIVLATLLVLAPFARAQDDPGEKGPYAVERERISLDFWSPSMEVRVPEGADGPRPVVLLVHGWGMMSSDYEWVADHLASRGFAVASFDMWNPLLLGPDLWASEAKRALDRLTTS
ncbi:MAG TPA: hypothetical protein VFF73_23790, partial [Planctomycetota bacterium]|nr:hypothetical protein [Planctomycetota bacterium]